MRNLRRPGAVGIAVQARIARRATTAARSRLLWKLGLGGVAVLGALGLWRTARITTTQHPRGGEKVVDLPPPATVPVVVDAAPPSKAADDTECPQTKNVPWWRLPGTDFLRCGFNVRARRTDSLALVVALAVDAPDLELLLKWSTDDDEFDTIFVSDDSALCNALSNKGRAVLRATPGTERVAIWNAMQHAARLTGYAHALFVSSTASAPLLAVRATFAAIRAGATLAVPTTNMAGAGASSEQWWAFGSSETHDLVDERLSAEAVQKKLHEQWGTRFVAGVGESAAVDDAGVRLSACAFAVHLARLERFSPALSAPFNAETVDSLGLGGEGDSRAADGLLLRMLAANERPMIVRSAFARCPAAGDLLVDVAVPPQPPLVQISRSYQALAWRMVPDEAIAGCDWEQNHIETMELQFCKAACLRMNRCAGFSHVKATSTCYLKTCAGNALYALQGVDSYLKMRVPVSQRDECTADPEGGSMRIAKADAGAKTRRVAIIVCVHDALSFVERCLRSIWERTQGQQYEVFLVNDQSSPYTLEALARLLEGRPTTHMVNWDSATDLDGYTRAVNLGLRTAMRQGGFEAYCLLNSDTEVVSASWLSALALGAFSSPEIGIVGPLSNAASYQSVPLLRDEVNGTSDWSKNVLPAGWTVEDVAQSVSRASRRLLIDVPILNGFCLFIKHAVVLRVGLMDDIAFPSGFGEENDFCLRALRLGYTLKVIDAVYVYHHKSKSYGDARRKRLALFSRGVLNVRWGPQLKSAIAVLESNMHLEECRRRLVMATRMSTCRGNSLRVLFVLNPIRYKAQILAMHGGWISIFNQAIGLRQRGACSMVAVSDWSSTSFEANFPMVREQSMLLLYEDRVRTPIELATALYAASANFDIMISTLFTTVETVGYLAQCHPHLSTGYFIQDYEADFDQITDEQRRSALDSYTAVPNMLLFAKTAWLRRKVERLHNVTVSSMRGSVDLSAFKRARELELSRLRITTSILGAPGSAVTASSGVASSSVIIDEPKGSRVVAMLRPTTPRRNTFGTLEVLAEVKRRFGDAVAIHTFGASDGELDYFLSQASQASLRVLGLLDHAEDTPAALRALVTHHGTLAREEVATLFARSDVFLDMSHWQAFGRTGLEAMSAGCVPVLPIGSGSEEYAEHDVNSKLSNTSNRHDAVESISQLVRDAKSLAKLRANGLETVKTFDLASASLTMLKLLCANVATHDARLFFMPSPCKLDTNLNFGQGDEAEARRLAAAAAAARADADRAHAKAEEAATAAHQAKTLADAAVMAARVATVAHASAMSSIPTASYAKNASDSSPSSAEPKKATSSNEIAPNNGPQQQTASRVDAPSRHARLR